MTFYQKIDCAVTAILAKDFNRAKQYIHAAMAEDDVSPMTHNLLGIIAELKADYGLARRQYRAAYALDPTFQASNHNLERLCISHNGIRTHAIDFGTSVKEPKKAASKTFQIPFREIFAKRMA